MPASFRFAPFWQTQAELWAPLLLANKINDRYARSLRVFARLKPGVSIRQAQAGMDAVASRLEAAYPQTNAKLGITVLSLYEKVVGPVRSRLLILLGTVTFVLLIACANVSNLLLTRAIARRKEMALRVAVGASRLRLVQQLLTESVFLATLGGGAGFLFARWGVTLLVAILPKASLPRQQEIGIDSAVFAFTLLLSIITGFLFGLAPAFQVSRSDLNENLRQGGRSSTKGARQQRTQSLLVAAEVSLALMLLVGAGLMIRTMDRLNAVDAGFNPHNLRDRSRLPVNCGEFPVVSGPVHHHHGSARGSGGNCTFSLSHAYNAECARAYGSHHVYGSRDLLTASWSSLSPKSAWFTIVTRLKPPSRPAPRGFARFS